MALPINVQNDEPPALPTTAAMLACDSVPSRFASTIRSKAGVLVRMGLFASPPSAVNVGVLTTVNAPFGRPM